MDIVLASGSPRRRELLERMGIQGFQILPPGVSEEVGRDLPPEAQVEQLSLRKAEAVRAQAGDDALVIAADTVVVLNGEVLGKPADEAEAFRMLCALSGVCHEVYTGFTVLRGGKRRTGHEMTRVTFRTLSQEDVKHYIASGECMDKAGAYGIQGCGALLVKGIEGDYYNVMGLPAAHLAEVLREFGVDCLRLCERR